MNGIGKISNNRLVLLFGFFLAIILLVRLISLWFNNSELFFDEAQYWFWAQELEFGYFSKPPLIAWVISLTTGLFDSNEAFYVRLAAPIIHICTAVVIFLITREMFDTRTGFCSGLIFATLPSVSLSSGIISTDVPLLFFWSVALFAYVKLQEEYDFGWVFLLGVSLGLAINAKYAGLYFIGCGIIHFLMKPSANAPARRFYFWLAVLIALIMLVPNLLWNLDNGLVTISHTGENISSSGYKFSFGKMLEFIASQLAVFGPINFVLLLIVYANLIKAPLSEQHRLLIAFSLPIILIIIVQAFLNKANANWAAPAYIAATILVADIFINRIPWKWIYTSISIHIFVFVVVAIAFCFAAPGEIKLSSGYEPFKRTQGASEIAAKVEEYLDKKEYNGIITTDRKLSALMQYNLRHREESILAWRAGDIPRDHFELDRAFQDSLRDPILIVSQRSKNQGYNKDFRSFKILPSKIISAGDIEKLYFFELSDHKDFE